MSALNTILRIDGRGEVLSYLSELGLQLPGEFRSRHPELGQVRGAVARMKGWSLKGSIEAGSKRAWMELYCEDRRVTTLMFADEEGTPVLGGTRGDPCLALLRELARDVGPLVVLLNASLPLLVEAPTR